MASDSTVLSIFNQCVVAIRDGKLIQRASSQDKEFHFQNWVRDRLNETEFHYDPGGRNSYPDFRMVNFAEGYEVKGLAYPGRAANYDANSQVPSGHHWDTIMDVRFSISLVVILQNLMEIPIQF